nr:MAG TPA_asm: hypothetical protein [Caudoviricetes sp.]
MPPVLLNLCWARRWCFASGLFEPFPPFDRELGSCIGFWRE